MLHICETTNDTQPETKFLFFSSLDTIEAVTGVNKTNVRRVLSRFCAKDWLEKVDREKVGIYTTKANCYRVKFHLKVSTGTHPHSEQYGEHQSEHDREHQGEYQGEYPKPATPTSAKKTTSNPNQNRNLNPNPAQSASETQSNNPEAVEGVGRFDEIFEKVFDREPKDRDNGKLRNFLHGKYAPIISDALSEHADQENTWLVDWCFAKRNNKQLPTPRFRACGHCFGKGTEVIKRNGSFYEVACHKCRAELHQSDEAALPTTPSNEGFEAFRQLNRERNK